MAAKKEDYNSLKESILQGDIKPVYLLQGEESYYIDAMMELILERLAPAPEDQDFDMQQFFGGEEVTIGDIVASCRQYPMMGQYRLVTVREAQALDKRRVNFEALMPYVEKPNRQTILVIAYKGGNLPSVKTVNAIKKVGAVMQSDKIQDYNLTKELPEILQSWGFKVDRDAIEMIANYVGNDLSKIHAEMEKVRVAAQGGKPDSKSTVKVTRDMVTQMVGMSREYNVWQLASAIANHDLKKIEIIRLYFERNPKAAPMPMLTASLFGFLQNVMLAYYCQDRKTPQGLMSELGCSYPAARDIIATMKWCSAWKALDNIAILREFDARSKGQRGGTTPDAELMKEMLYRLTH